jgi:hypothetical protein
MLHKNGYLLHSGSRLSEDCTVRERMFEHTIIIIIIKKKLKKNLYHTLSENKSRD